MKATQLTLTTFSVEADSLSCNRPNCRFVSHAAKHKIGDACPRCKLNLSRSKTFLLPQVGVLERSAYHCDLEALNQNGACGCYHFELTLKNKIEQLPPSQRSTFRYRCKHLKCAREEAKKDENFDALLALLPNQEYQV